MKKVAKVRIILLCLSLLIILTVLVISFREKKRQIVIESENSRGPSDNASIELENVSYSTTNKNNFKEWDLQARTAQYFKDENRVVLEDLAVNLYLDDKKYHLRAQHGEFDTETRDITMKGKIKGILPDGTEIQTETVCYEHQKRIITSEDKILIKREKFSIEGLGMVIDVNKEKLSILGKVKALGSR